MRLCFRYSYLLLIASITATSTPAAGETIEAHLNALKSSPACTTTPPEGINPDLYLWSMTQTDAYHGDPRAYSKNKMFYCHGQTPETENILYVWPSWGFHTREDWYYPIEIVDTVAGLLTKRGREMPERHLFLNGTVFMKAASARVLQAYSFSQDKPEIIVAAIEKQGPLPQTEAIPLTILDLGVSPPFISDYLYISGNALDSEDRIAVSSLYGELSSQKEDIRIEKISENKFLISGWPLRAGNIEAPTQERFVYDRKMRSMTKAE